ncbi:Negative regulator of mitotic exit [Gryganskiella cystojenkinii]|nr:Negative regulator of mitotic exit [Gryganskiella cystojenkinii]
MAGLFSKKNKKDKEDTSSTNSSTNARYQGGVSNGRPSQSSNGRDDSSAINSVAYSHSDYGSLQQQQQHQQQIQQQYYGQASAYSSKSSLPYSNSNHQQGTSSSFHLQSNASVSTHNQSMLNQYNNHGNTSSHPNSPWTHGVLMSTNPFPRFSHTASYVSTGTDIYISGGMVKGSAMKDIHAIDFQSLHCQLIPVSGDGPSGLNGHTAVALGQYVLYFGGKDAKGKISDTLYVLHTARKQWNKPLIQTLLPAPRHSHAACMVNTVMYVFGGQLSGFYMNDIASFDAKTLNGKRPVWTQLDPKSDLPPARAGHCAASFDGKVYIFGGADNKYYYNDIWCYNPETDRWSSIAAFGTLPDSRQGHTTVVIDDTMYVFGGMNNEDRLLGDLWAFNFTERRWTCIPTTVDTASPRSEHAMCNVGDKIYIFGGQLDLNTKEDSATVFILDTTKIPWNDLASMTAPRTLYEHENMHLQRVQNEEATSSYRTPTPDQQQRHQEEAYTQDSPRRGNHHQHQQQQQHLARQESYNQGHQSQQQQQQQHYDQENDIAQESSRLSLEFNEATHVARRRTIGKPVGFSIQEIENGSPRSRDAPAIHQMQDQDSLEREHSRAKKDNSRSYNSGPIPTVHQLQPSALPNTNSSRAMNGGSSTSGTTQQLSHLDLNRQTSTNSAANQGLTRQGSHVDRASYTSITHMQARTVDPSQRAALRITNPDGPADTPAEQIKREYRLATAAAALAAAAETARDRTVNETSSMQSIPSTPMTPLPAKDDVISGEIKDLRQREQWLMAEVSMARKRMGDRPLSMAIMALEDELEACEVDSEKYKIMQALLNVKSELERSKTSIATQAQMASNKIKEAERVRTSALQEAAYLKAKVNALQSGEVSALVQTETMRAQDLENRLTAALTQLETYEAQFVQYETILEHERMTREAAEERERDASSRAEEAQIAHTRALNELTTLHERASVAEASLRESVANRATSEAGLSSYQQQSAALLSQITTLKTTVDHQKKSLDKAKMAYTVANERAEHADKLWTQSRQEIDRAQLLMGNIQADIDRAQREAEHWRAKTGEMEVLWHKAKADSEAMRVLLEEDMNSPTSAAASLMTKDRKHDSIMAITSASRVAELEHELTTLRQLLRESQDAASQSARDLSDTMLRISQLEQSSMSARAEAATAQRQLKESRDKVALLQAKLIRKEEEISTMFQDQETNKNINAGASNSTLVPELQSKAEEAEKRRQEVEDQLLEMVQLKQDQEARIQQLEADYQASLHYVQSAESVLNRLQEELQLARKNNNSFESQQELEEEVEELLRRLDESEQKAESLAVQLRKSDTGKDLRSRLEQMEEELDRAHALNKVTGQELEEALDELKKNKNSNSSSSKDAELEVTVQNLRKANQELEEQLRSSENKISLLLDNFQAGGGVGSEAVRNSVASLSHLLMDLQHRRGSNDSATSPTSPTYPTSPLRSQFQLGSFQVPTSPRQRSTSTSSSQNASSPTTSFASRSGRFAQAASTSDTSLAKSGPPRITTTSNNDLAASSSTTSSPSSSSKALTNSQKLEEYEKMIEEMTNARRLYEE